MLSTRARGDKTRQGWIGESIRSLGYSFGVMSFGVMCFE